MRRGVDAPGLTALIPSCPGYFRLALGMWSCAFTHERFAMKTLCPSQLPFPQEAVSASREGSETQNLLLSSAGVAWEWWLQVPWPAGQGWEAQRLRFPTTIPCFLWCWGVTAFGHDVIA